MLVATGHAKLNMRFNLMAAVAVPAVLYFGSRWGMTGVALAWVIGYPLITIPTFFRQTLRILDLRASAYLRTLWPAASAAAGIAAAVLGLRAVVPSVWPTGLRLGMEGLAGAVGYLPGLLVAPGTPLPLVTPPPPPPTPPPAPP